MHKRKSPARHQVSAHTRRGHPVQSYPRGEGERAPRTRRRRVVGGTFDQNTPMGAHAWTVNFTYDDPTVKGETVLVFADTYDSVIDEAFDEREYKHLVPTATELIDPSIGEVLSAVKKGAKKVAGLGAKYTVTALKAGGRAAKAAGQGTLRLTKYKAQSKYVEVLLRDVYGPPGPRRTAARYALKKNYPDVWDMTSLSVDPRY